MILLRRIYRTQCQKHIRALSLKLKESLLFGRSVIRAFIYGRTDINKRVLPGEVTLESFKKRRMWSGAGRVKQAHVPSEGRTPLPSLVSPSIEFPAPSRPPALPALRILGQAKASGRLTATRGRANRR